MTTLWFDTETFSPTPIKDGVHRYAESAEIMISAYAIDDGPVIVEDITAPGNGLWTTTDSSIIKAIMYEEIWRPVIGQEGASK